MFIPNEHVLEECLRREADRLSHQDSLMNRVVYDCIDPSPHYVDKQCDDIEVKIERKDKDDGRGQLSMIEDVKIF